MDQAAHPTKTTLPGIGTRYDLITDGGKHVSLVVHNDGRRFLGFHDPQDDDSCKASVPLDPGEATALAQLLPIGDILFVVRRRRLGLGVPLLG